MALNSSEDSRMVNCLFVAGSWCQLLVGEMALTLWANLILKRRDAVLTKVKDNISESFMALGMLICLVRWICSLRKLSRGPLRSPAGSSTMRPSGKVSQDKPAKKLTKCLQFSLSSRQPQSSKRSACLNFRKASVGVRFLSIHSALKLLLLLQMWVFCLPHCCRWEVY